MKITDTRKHINGPTFADLAVGQVFVDPDGDICMKIKCNMGGQANAVLLSTGIAFYICEDDEVVLVKAEVIISEG